MSGDMPMWKGLFEWSMKYQDGTTNSSATAQLNPQDRQWLEDALKGAMVDLGDRMKDIKESLESDDAAPAPAIDGTGEPSSSSPSSSPSASSSPATLEQKEQMLDELLDLVESIDQAKDLSTIGGLPTLLTLLRGAHPSLQCRAAEVMATCVQNNPEVQRSFLLNGAMPAVWSLLDHENTTCQIKGLLAVSCMIRGSPPALAWFRQQSGIAKTVELLSNSDPRVQRKCLQILHYALQTVPSDKPGACLQELPLIPALTLLVTKSEDHDVRAAALAVGQALAEDDACRRGMKGDEAFVQAVQAVQCRLDTLEKEDWGPAEDEAKVAMALAAALERPVPRPPQQQQQGAQVSEEMSGSLQIMAVPE